MIFDMVIFLIVLVQREMECWRSVRCRLDRLPQLVAAARTSLQRIDLREFDTVTGIFSITVTLSYRTRLLRS